MAKPGSALFILGSTVLGTLIGYPLGGLLGSLAGGLTGVCVSMIADTVRKAKVSTSLNEGQALAIDGLNPQQQFAVLGQGLGGGAIDFRPRALAAAARAEELAEGDLEAGLREARALEAAHPHTPAVSMVHARLALRAEQPERAAEAASRALARATRGGMNAVAVATLREVPESLRDRLMLPRASWEQLGRALRAAGDTQEADWAFARSREVDPELDARLREEAMREAGRALRQQAPKITSDAEEG